MKQRIIYSSSGERTYEINDRVVTEEYFHSVTQGQDEAKLKDMLKSGVPPQGVSDCTFMRDTANGRQFQGQEHIGNQYRAVAEEHGQNVTGKKYISGLARFPGDPEAWVEGRGDVQKLVESRGWGCEGTVNVKKRELLNPPEPGPEVAPDLLEKYTNVIADAQPMPHLVDREDLKEQVKERIKPKHRPKGVTKAD
jgi:hypothetical protein